MRSASQRTGPRSPISPKPALVVHLRGAMVSRGPSPEKLRIVVLRTTPYPRRRAPP